MNEIRSTGLRVPVYETISSLLPRNLGVSYLLNMGEILRILHFIGRQIRIIRRPENLVLMGAGGVLNVASGQIPAVRYAAKAVFLCLSILKCTEDILELHRTAGKMRNVFLGNGYVLLKKNKIYTPSIEEQIRWQSKVYDLQFATLFYLIGEFFKRFSLLALHLSDVYMALRDNHVTEVFVYGKQLLDKVIVGDAILLQKLRQNETTNNKILEKLGVKTSFNLMLKTLEIPVTVQQKLPSASDMKTSLKRRMTFSIHKIKAITESHVESLQSMGGSISQEERNFITYRVGGECDPNAHRYLPEIQKGKGPKS